MSGLEALGVAASIIQIADLGAQVAIKLSTFYRKVKQANENIQNLSTDVALTCTVLKQLGDNLRQDEQVKLYSPDAFSVAKEIMRECEKVFRQIESAMEDDASTSVNSSTVKSRFQKAARKLHFVFLEPQLSVLQSNIDRLKSTMLLMLNVIIYAGQVRRQEAEARREEQKEIIEILADEKRVNDKKYQQLTNAIEAADTQRVPPSAEKEIASFMAMPQQDNFHDSDEPISDELEQYANLIKSLLTSVDQMKLALDQARYRRIKQGVLTIHDRETRWFQSENGPRGLANCSNLFAGPLFESGTGEMEQIEFEKEKHEHHHHHHMEDNTQILEGRRIVELERTTYIKVHSKYLLPQTLEVYHLPWEWQQDDPNYIVIKQCISEDIQEQLFAHTKQLREHQSANAQLEAAITSARIKRAAFANARIQRTWLGPVKSLFRWRLKDRLSTIANAIRPKTSRPHTSVDTLSLEPELHHSLEHTPSSSQENMDQAPTQELDYEIANRVIAVPEQRSTVGSLYSMKSSSYKSLPDFMMGGFAESPHYSPNGSTTSQSGEEIRDLILKWTTLKETELS